MTDQELRYLIIVRWSSKFYLEFCNIAGKEFVESRDTSSGSPHDTSRRENSRAHLFGHRSRECKERGFAFHFDGYVFCVKLTTVRLLEFVRAFE